MEEGRERGTFANAQPHLSVSERRRKERRGCGTAESAKKKRADTLQVIRVQASVLRIS